MLPSAARRRRSSAGQSSCLSSRRPRVRVPSVAPRRRGRMEKAPVYETGGAGSTPAVDAQLAVAQWTRAPPSEGGGRTFESCRRGVMSMTGPCSSASRARPRYGRGRWVRLPPRAPSWKGTGQMRSPFATRVRVSSPCGCESRPFRSGKRSGQMRSLSRKQVGVARPLWVRVPPLPPPCRGSPTDTTPGPQPGGRGSTPRRGTRDARSSNGKDVRLLPRLWGFESSSGSAPPGGRGSRHAAADRVTGVRVPPGRPCRSDATERDPSSPAHPCGSEIPLQAGWATAGTPRSDGFTDRRPCGRRSTARMRARHAGDAGSIPAGHTNQPTTTRRG